MLCALPLASGEAEAATAQEAQQFVDELGKKAVEAVNEKSQQKLQQLFLGNVDVNWMGKFVLGHAWQQATEEQRSHYIQAYRDYLLARYTTNFAEYAGSDYTITGAKSEADGQFSVGMKVKSPQAKDQETQAGYRVQSINGQFKIVDIIIEGVSLITTQRSEFAAVVQKDGMDKLIEQLKAKAQAKAA